MFWLFKLSRYVGWSNCDEEAEEELGKVPIYKIQYKLSFVLLLVFLITVFLPSGNQVILTWT